MKKMKKFDIKKSFQNNKFKYGGYATLLTSIVLVVLIVANLVVGQLDLKLDMTKNKLYSLSNQSFKIMDGLKQDVTVICFNKTGSENAGVKEILDKYSNHSKKISIKYIDPATNPQIASKYSNEGTTIAAGNIVVESGTKFKVLSQSDLYTTTTDQTTGQTSAQSLIVEQKITGAIMYVVNSKNLVVYNLQGHGEQALSTTITTAMTNQNFPIKTLNLLSDKWQPQTGDMLLISSPQSDISADELTKLKDFFAKGGRGIFLMDIVQAKDFPNFKALMATLGVEINKSVILEGDASYMYQSPVYLLPKMNTQDIVSPLISAKLPVLFPAAQPIQQLKVKKSTLTVEPLLSTTDKSWGKVNLSSKSTEKESGDINGPFDVAVAITDKLDASDATKNAKVVIFSSSAFIQDQILSATGGGNENLFMNSLNWVQDLKDNISITPKDLTSETITITDAQRLGYSALVVVVIPAIVIVAGIVVWIRRKNL